MIPDPLPLIEMVVPLAHARLAQWLAGVRDANLRVLEQELMLSALLQGEGLTLKGSASGVALAQRVVAELLPLADGTEALIPAQVRYAVAALRDNQDISLQSLQATLVVETAKGKPVRPKTFKQRDYVEAIASHTLTFGIGPAGTGKTYLAAAMAVAALKEKSVGRIILTRPVVEAGESLGFLPGDFQAKVDPYFRPLYDAMIDLLEAEKFTKYLERGMIEVAPLAYMRGRTLNDAFIILDEAQNTTPEQMKMFLTRIGMNSRVVVTGDASQVDLPRGKRSALWDVEPLLGGVPDIAFVRFKERDVVRHELVRRIVVAYEAWEQTHGR
jgi:phosphate starvation-inducible PhoH-like protein